MSITCFLSFSEGVNKRGEEVYVTRLRAYYKRSKYILAVEPEKWKEKGKEEGGTLKLIDVDFKNKEKVLILYPEGKKTILLISESMQGRGKWGDAEFRFVDLPPKAPESLEILMRDFGYSNGGGQGEGYTVLAIDTKDLKKWTPIATIYDSTLSRTEGEHYVYYGKLEGEELRLERKKFVPLDVEERKELDLRDLSGRRCICAPFSILQKKHPGQSF